MAVRTKLLNWYWQRLSTSSENWLLPSFLIEKDIAFERKKWYIRLVNRRSIHGFTIHGPFMTVLAIGKTLYIPIRRAWLQNFLCFVSSYGTDISQSAEPPHVPAIPKTIQKAERDSAFYLACTTEQITSLQPISVLDVFQTLQVSDFLGQNYDRLF